MNALNLPAALIERLHDAYGERAGEVLRGYETARPVTFRVNPCKTTRQEVADRLNERHISFSQPEWYEDAFVLCGGGEDCLIGTPLYERGEIYLQSLSSMLPPIVLSPRAGETILDMTAAPGGKTTQMAALSGGKAPITACERDAIRYERLCFNLRRQGAERVSALHTDALTLNDGLKFDKILLDAPCTGSGTIAPGSRVRFSDAYLSKCAALQKKLIAKALRLLKPGGMLVYSTCSVLPEENDDAAAYAVSLGARALPVQLPVGIPLLPSRQRTVCVCPDELYEGFYIAAFIK